MAVPQYTTPTLVLTFQDENLDLTQASQIIVTLESKTKKQIEKTGQDLTVEAKSISVDLSQQESSALAVGEVKVMVNWILPNGKRAASKQNIVDISENLHRKVM